VIVRALDGKRYASRKKLHQVAPGLELRTRYWHRSRATTAGNVRSAKRHREHKRRGIRESLAKGALGRLSTPTPSFFNRSLQWMRGLMRTRCV